jgi:hypothetical protein
MNSNDVKKIGLNEEFAVCGLREATDFSHRVLKFIHPVSIARTMI